jgi:DNA recombination protein RmuC
MAAPEIVAYVTLALAALAAIAAVALLAGRAASARALAELQRRIEEQEKALAGARAAIDGVQAGVQREFATARAESGARGDAVRAEVVGTVQKFGADLEQRMIRLSDTLAVSLKEVRGALDGQLDKLREENNAKLDQMRAVVEEKLQKTLEDRLGDSFKQVSEHLATVQKGLGEMSAIAGDVGDLRRVLTNVKTRGGWAEIQLEAMLEQFLSPEQYEKNAAIQPGASERVEFAVKLPSKDEDGRFILLPIDAKFPKEDYERLADATERADGPAMLAAGRALEDRLRNEAKRIRAKYVVPPYSTDFGLMYLPTEGLYAEVARRPGLLAELQTDSRIMVAGPSTLVALLNSLQMGFRTLAISKRSSEVWTVLGQAKTEFARFGDTIEKARLSIDRAGKSLDGVGVRTRAIERRLRGVEAMPAEGAFQIEAEEPADEDKLAGPQ